MFAVSGNDDRVVQCCVLFDNGLHVADLRTGGVNDCNAAFPDFFPFVRCNAVCADDQNGIFMVADFVNAFNGRNTAIFQQLDGLRIMDQGTIGVDSPAHFMLGNVENLIHRPADAHAKPGCFGQFDFHLVCFPR